MPLILFGGIRPQTRLAYVKTHERQWIISSITVQPHDFLMVCGPCVRLMKTLFHGWARKAGDRRRIIQSYAFALTKIVPNSNGSRVASNRSRIVAVSTGTRKHREINNPALSVRKFNRQPVPYALICDLLLKNWDVSCMRKEVYIHQT